MDHQPLASASGVDETHGGWVADPVRQPHLLDAWIEHVEARHQVGAGGSGRPLRLGGWVIAACLA